MSSKDKSDYPFWTKEIGRSIFDAALIVAIAGSIGLIVNLVHPNRIAIIAEKEYETLVPCPEPGGKITVMAIDDPKLQDPKTFLIDARPKIEFSDWRYRDAMNIPYDYLDPIADSTIEELVSRIAHNRSQRVVVYGDGQQPDSGEQLAKEISAKGIKNVFFIPGGAVALRQKKNRKQLP